MFKGFRFLILLVFMPLAWVIILKMLTIVVGNSVDALANSVLPFLVIALVVGYYFELLILGGLLRRFQFFSPEQMIPAAIIRKIFFISSMGLIPPVVAIFNNDFSSYNNSNDFYFYCLIFVVFVFNAFCLLYAKLENILSKNQLFFLQMINFILAMIPFIWRVWVDDYELYRVYYLSSFWPILKSIVFLMDPKVFILFMVLFFSLVIFKSRVGFLKAKNIFLINFINIMFLIFFSTIVFWWLIILMLMFGVTELKFGF